MPVALRSTPPRPPLAARVGLAAALCLGLGGCSSLQSSDNVLGFITPYRLEVVQGNVVTQEQAAKVQPGMTRTQVRDILGSPLLTDIFHADRWDYAFTIRRQGTPPQQRMVVVKFDGDVLKSIDAPELPAERAFVASIDTQKVSRKKGHSLALTEEQIKALPAPKAAPAVETAAATAAPAATRAYPPLETP